MSFTVSIRSTIESAETLARTTIAKAFASWSVSSSENQIVSVPYGTTVNLPAYTTFLISADPLATQIVVGWVYQTHVVEVPLNGLTVVTPGATPYLRNTSSDSTTNPVPVRVVAFS